MDLNWLEDFLALAEHGTFARAAETRNVTQPAFSRRIQSLEEWMGTRLFARSPQGTSLTPAGAFLRAHAEDLTRSIHRLRQETLEVAGREASLVSIAATHALSFVFFPGWIRSHPGFATLGPLNLISDTMEACEQIMSRGDADFMLCHCHRDAMPRLEASQFTSAVIGRDLLLPLCAPDGDGAARWPLPADPLSPPRLLSYGPQSGLGRIVSAVLEKNWPRLSFQKMLTAQLAATLLTMARQGDGIAWLPRTLAQDDVAAGRLVDPGQGRYSIDVEIRLIRPLRRQTPAAEAFWASIPDSDQPS
ncbi:LysR family transcriptional regulator [Azospirillum sp. SYSU D00513]|uniref:LysR family transcriptional regulator n=1 Tax=Azospirillum sp. SYSU D00513 TaxID=2812561 RepID=UPI001A96E010|nr:LysR family transcriptional regulator [Azospirillum sp. SYSU D00513]